MPDRRTFLARSVAAVAATLLPSTGRAFASRAFTGRTFNSRAFTRLPQCHDGALGPHPTPRPGVTSEKVMTKEQLASRPELIPLFDAVREMPSIADGIRCNCGCSSMPGFYSLLSCYEGQAMAMHCPVCQGQGRLAARLHKSGKSLDEIRVAVDAQFG